MRQSVYGEKSCVEGEQMSIETACLAVWMPNVWHESLGRACQPVCEVQLHLV